MKLKKAATLGMVTIMALGQAMNAMAATTYTLTVSYAKPTQLGSGIFHSTGSIFKSSSSTHYLKTSMTVNYYPYGVALDGYTVYTGKASSDKTNVISSFTTWTDTGADVARKYTTYSAAGYRRYSSTGSWNKESTKSGNVSSLQ